MLSKFSILVHSYTRTIKTLYKYCLKSTPTRFYGVVGSTWDSESHNLSSNLSRTTSFNFCFVFSLFSVFYYLVVAVMLS